MDRNFELIKDKLRKILELRDRGFGGEAAAAEAALIRMCEKYGISIDKVLEDEKKLVFFDGVSNKLARDILFACYFKVTNTAKVSYQQKGRGVIGFELTPAEAIDLTELFGCMKKAYARAAKQAAEDFKEAFIVKNRLYSTGACEEDASQLSPEEIQRLRRILAISLTIEPTMVPRKMIER